MTATVKYFLYLGATCFGGPVVLVSRMRKNWVDDRQWIDEKTFNEGLALSQLAPGPLATQQAIYLGWIKHGFLGATCAGISFVLPSFIIVSFLALLYKTWGALNWLQGVFYGIGGTVIALIVLNVYSLSVRTLKKDKLYWSLAILSAVSVVFTQSEIFLVFLISGVIAVIFKGRLKLQRKLFTVFPVFLLTGLKGAASAGILWKLFVYFIEVGAFVFGSGMVILPFLYQGVVRDYQWLTDRQFLDAVTVGMITPGPVVITVAFVGYLVAGPLGGFVSALGIFLPCYGFVILALPFYKKILVSESMQVFTEGITCAAIGAIAGAAWILGKKTLHDLPTVVIFMITFVLLLKFKKIPEIVLIFLTGLIGYFLKAE